VSGRDRTPPNAHFPPLQDIPAAVDHPVPICPLAGSAEVGRNPHRQRARL